MAKKNSYLAKQQAMNQGFLEVGMDTGFQKCWDLIQRWYIPLSNHT